MTAYQEGELILRCVTDRTYDSLTMIISHKKGQEEKEILGFSPEIMNTKRYGEHSVGIYDSDREELGEVAFQMHGNTSVDRPQLPYGIILCICDDFTEPGNRAKRLQDVSALRSVEFMDALAELCLQYLRSILVSTASGMLPLYFVYYGRDHVECDGSSFKDDFGSLQGDKEYANALESVIKMGRAVFKSAKESKKYGVFRCVAGLTTYEFCYLAVVGETKDPRLLSRSPIGKVIKSAKEFPKIVNGSDMFE